MNEQVKKGKNHIQVQVTSSEGVSLPFYATEGAAGMDIRAFIDEPIVLQPGQVQCIPTGLQVAIPEGFELQIRPRSGLSLKSQVIPLNTPGTIDCDYRGEIKVILANLGKEPFEVTAGMRIAQMIAAPYYQVDWKKVDKLDATRRGEHGFGGTGIH